MVRPCQPYVVDWIKRGPVTSKRDEIKHDSIEWAGVTIAYSWCHSRRRTLCITVRPDRSISVRVPLRTPVKEIRAFVTCRAEWVLKVLKKLNAMPCPQQQGYGSGAIFMYRGKNFRLEFEISKRSSLYLQDENLVLASLEIPSKETVRRMIDSWYRKQALEIVKERSIECHNMLQVQGEEIPLPPITIRFMKTRWGSYSYRTRRITLNLNLVKMPQICLDYVIIHELCHIKVRHHGPDFWRMVSRYVPEYLVVRRQLRQYS